jgi:uncharacterized protein (TIGR00645 family)
MPSIKDMERLVERVILTSRWILVVFYLVLSAALAVYAVFFLKKFLTVTFKVFKMTESDVILAMLSLIDACLVASLIVMVMISGYENFVSRFDDSASELSWLGKIDTGSLKIKIASSIVAISSIHLLQVFLNAAEYPNDKIMWSLLLHATFVFSAVFLAMVDRVAHFGTHAHESPAGRHDGPRLEVEHKA